MIFPSIAFLFAFGFADARPQHDKCLGHTVEACPSGMHIVSVRGTTEEPGHGAMKPLVDGLKEIYPGSDDLVLDYPASGITLPEEPGGKPVWDLVGYQESEGEGYDALKLHLENYAKECKNTPIILLGYSQGAHVVGDVLCGNKNLVGGPAKPAIDQSYTSNIRGVIELGDPANNALKPWHQGNGSYSGMFIRGDYKSCKALLTDFGQSWCDEKDFFCEFLKWYLKGDIIVHQLYVQRHKDEILAQAKKLVDAYEGQASEFKFISQGFDL